MSCFLLVLFPQLLLHRFQLRKEHRKHIHLSMDTVSWDLKGLCRSLEKKHRKLPFPVLFSPMGTVAAKPGQHLPFSGFPQIKDKDELVRNNVSIFFHVFVTIRYLTRSKSYYSFPSSSVLGFPLMVLNIQKGTS